MPAWVAAYFALYLALSGWSLWDDVRAETSQFWVLLELLSDLCLLLPAFAYWLPGLLALPSFVLGAALLPLVVCRTIRKNFPDPEFSSRENRWIAIASVVLTLVVAAPLLWWGNESAVMERYAAAP